MDMKTIMIGLLLVLVAVLGYRAYEQNQRTVKIELPSVKMGSP
jgi:predicted negative regulator of RcsB-dependent stress response